MKRKYAPPALSFVTFTFAATLKHAIHSFFDIIQNMLWYTWFHQHIIYFSHLHQVTPNKSNVHKFSYSTDCPNLTHLLLHPLLSIYLSLTSTMSFHTTTGTYITVTITHTLRLLNILTTKPLYPLVYMACRAFKSSSFWFLLACCLVSLCMLIVLRAVSNVRLRRLCSSVRTEASSFYTIISVTNEYTYTLRWITKINTQQVKVGIK